MPFPANAYAARVSIAIFFTWMEEPEADAAVTCRKHSLRGRTMAAPLTVKKLSLNERKRVGDWQLPSSDEIDGSGLPDEGVGERCFPRD